MTVNISKVIICRLVIMERSVTLAGNVCIVEYTNSFLREHQKIVGLIFNNLSWFMQDFHCQKGVATIQPALLQKILYILKRTQDI